MQAVILSMELCRETENAYRTIQIEFVDKLAKNITSYSIRHKRTTKQERAHARENKLICLRVEFSNKKINICVWLGIEKYINKYIILQLC